MGTNKLEPGLFQQTQLIDLTQEQELIEKIIL